MTASAFTHYRGVDGRSSQDRRVGRMDGEPPFVLVPLDDGRYELRAFSDNTEDPIMLVLDEDDGRKLGIAVADMLTAIDSPGVERLPIHLTIAGREITILATTDGGLRLTVSR